MPLATYFQFHLYLGKLRLSVLNHIPRSQQKCSSQVWAALTQLRKRPFPLGTLLPLLPQRPLLYTTAPPSLLGLCLPGPRDHLQSQLAADAEASAPCGKPEPYQPLEKGGGRRAVSPGNSGAPVKPLPPPDHHDPEALKPGFSMSTSQLGSQGPVSHS